MLKNFIQVSVVMIAMLASVPAVAGGFYLAVDAGILLYTNTSSLSYWGTDFLNPAAITLGGGYNLNDYFGVEAGYVVVGDSKTTTTGFINTDETLSSSASYAALVGTLPVSDRFGFFGKIGVAHTSIDYSFSGTPGSASASGGKSNAMLGVGWDYNFTQHWQLRVQYEDFGKTFVGPIILNGTPLAGTGGDIGMSVVSVGGEYRF